MVRRACLRKPTETKRRGRRATQRWRVRYAELSGAVLLTCANGAPRKVSGITACVFGSTGFLGRYVVNAIARQGTRMILPNRADDQEFVHLKVMGDLGQIVGFGGSATPHILRDEGLLAKALEGVDVVVNLVGREYETPNYKFSEVHVDIPRRIARLATEAGVLRFVHASCVGAAPDAANDFYKSKYEGEQAVFSEFEDASIVRMGTLIGAEDYSTNDIANKVVKSSYVPIWDEGDTRIRPLHVADAAAGITALATSDMGAGKIFTFVGPKVLTMKELHKLVIDEIREADNTISLPLELGLAVAKASEMVTNRIPVVLPSWLLDAKMSSDYLKGLSSGFHYAPTDESIAGADLRAVGFEPRDITKGLALEHLRSYRYQGIDFGTKASDAGASVSLYKRQVTQAEGWQELDTDEKIRKTQL